MLQKKKLSAGEDNPGYNHNGRLSAWSKNFVHGYDESKHRLRIESHTILVNEHKDRFKNNIEYWVKEHNGDIDKATDSLHTFQRRDLSWFTLKYGQEEGKVRYQAKTEKWLKTMADKTDEEKLRINKAKAAGIGKKSKAETAIVSQLKLAGLVVDHQFIVQKDDSTWYYYDIKLGNKIIEFNGDYWHCNPDIYPADYYNKRTHKTAAETWDKDKLKCDYALKKGYELLVIWENKYNSNKEQVIQECINFLTT